MTELAEILASTSWLLALVVFVFGLLVGSFLNVVIHRLPIMMDREWQAQAREVLRGTKRDAPTDRVHAADDQLPAQTAATRSQLHPNPTTSSSPAPAAPNATPRSPPCRTFRS